MYAEDNYARELQRRRNLAFLKDQEANETHIQRRKDISNLQRHTQPYEVGDRVYLRNQTPRIGVSRKLDGNCVGPYRIVDKKCPVMFKIREIQGTKEPVVNTDRMKRCCVESMPTNKPNSNDKVDNDLVTDLLFADVFGHALDSSECAGTLSRTRALHLDEPPPSLDPTTQLQLEPTSPPLFEPTTQPPTEPISKSIPESTSPPLLEPTTPPPPEPISEPVPEPIPRPHTRSHVPVPDHPWILTTRI